MLSEQELLKLCDDGLNAAEARALPAGCVAVCEVCHRAPDFGMTCAGSVFGDCPIRAKALKEPT